MKLVQLLMVLFFSGQALSAEFTPYVGGYLGLNSLKGINNEAAKNGYSLGVKGVGSFEFDSMFLDGGLGYQNMEINGGGVKITTRNIFVELDARLKMGSWQVGAGFKSESGTDNTGQEFIGSSTQTNSIMAKAIYQTQAGGNPFRWEIGLGTSVGLERTLTSAQVGIQVGFPDLFKSNQNKSASVAKTQPVAQSNNNDTEEVADIKISLKAAKVLFGTDKFELGKETESKLRKLGQYLSNNLDNWSRIKISGHTDITGDAVHNKALSQDRADSVLKVFTSAGVPEVRLSSYGYGPNRPLDQANTPEAYSKNRRTEIEFFGVKDRTKLNQAIKDILK